MSKKLFNRKKSPYTQMLEHKGPMIVHVVDSEGTIDRIRVVHTKAHFKSRWDNIRKYPVKGPYDYQHDFENRITRYKEWLKKKIADNDHNFSSCFAEDDYGSPRSYTESIQGMKEWDKGQKLKVMHIDFF